MLQNRSENLKMSDASAKVWLSMGFYNDFRNAHTKSTIKVHTFGVKGTRGPIHSIKTEVRRTHVRHTRRRARFWPKKALNASGARGHVLNLEKHSVWAKWVPGNPRTKTAGSGQGTSRRGAAMTDSLTPTPLKLFNPKPWLKKSFVPPNFPFCIFCGRSKKTF